MLSGMAEPSEAARVLSAIAQGDPSAAARLLPLVYDELRRLAARPGPRPVRSQGRKGYNGVSEHDGHFGTNTAGHDSFRWMKRVLLEQETLGIVPVFWQDEPKGETGADVVPLVRQGWRAGRSLVCAENSVR
jgi:hypothetical protein